MIDWNRVSELREEIGPEDFGEVVEIFLEEMEEEISALRQDPSNDMLESKLHFLKGSALNIGFDAFAKLCQAGESAAAEGAFDQIDLPQVLRTYEGSKIEFVTTLENRFAA